MKREEARRRRGGKVEVEIVLEGGGGSPVSMVAQRAAAELAHVHTRMSAELRMLLQRPWLVLCYITRGEKKRVSR
jgi:hypothetical protein